MRKRLTLMSGQIMTFVMFFVLWELVVRLLQIKPVILPARIGMYVSRDEATGGTEIVAKDLKKGFPHVTATVTPL